MIFILLLPLFFFSCTQLPFKRILSAEEKNTLHLNGIIHEARICPTVFNEKTKASQVIGSCEWVTCEESQNHLECWATQENN